jgi:hypothetical protein
MGIYWIIFFLFLGINSHAQLFDFNRIYPVPVNNKWGYIDCNGKLALAPIYDYANDFHNSKYAIVRKGRFYAVIDASGHELIPFAYERIRFCWGITSKNDYLYIVYNGAKYGVVNLKNEIIIPFQYEVIQELNNQLFRVKNNEGWLAVDVENKVIIPADYKSIKSKRNWNNLLMAKDRSDKWAVFSPAGKQISLPIFDHPNMNVSRQYINGMASATPITINHEGVVQQHLNMKISRFYKKSKAVARGENNLYGIIDQDFNWIIAPMYKALSYETHYQYSNVALFLEEDNWGLINLNGDVLIEAKHARIDYVTESIVALSANDMSYKLFNWTTAEWVNESEYTDCVGNSKAELIEVNYASADSEKERWGILNKKGEVLLSGEYEEVWVWEGVVELTKDLEEASEGIFSILKQKIIVPPIFSRVDYDSNRLCKVTYQESQRNKIAYLSPSGRVVWSAAGFDVQKLIDDYFQK